MVVDDGGGSKKRSRAVLLVLCGLPGAGKTTLARCLEAWLREEEAADRVVHYVGFDAIEACLRSPEGELKAFCLLPLSVARSDLNNHSIKSSRLEP